MPELPKSVVERMKAQAAPQGHPEADLLAAFSEQALTGRERENVLAHLAVCSACREAVALAAPQPAAEQLAGVFAPWYKRPQIFAWAGTLATLALVGALILNYGQYRSSTPMTSDATPAKVATPKPAENAENKAAAPASRDSVNGSLGQLARNEPLRQDSSLAKEEREQKKRKADEIHAATAMAAGAPLPMQAPEKDQKTDGGVLADQFKVMKEPATAPQPPTAAVAQATRAANVNAIEEKQQPSAGKEADAVESVAAARSKNTDIAASAGVAGGRLYQSKAGKTAALVPRWSISDKGKLQRSVDSGRTWQPALASESTIFRALAVVGNEVWAGGSGAAMFHSADGATWTRQTLPGASSDVVSLQFTDIQHGTARTADGLAWATSDGGQHWTKQ